MKKASVLIVEDEIIIGMDIQNTLEDMGYIVPAIATNGEEAVLLAESIRPDLILMDVILAGGMDGIEAASRINSFSDVPIIFVTAYANSSVMQRAKTTRHLGIISKPLDSYDIQEMMETALHG